LQTPGNHRFNADTITGRDADGRREPGIVVPPVDARRRQGQLVNAERRDRGLP